jgi:four helix bundle protein
MNSVEDLDVFKLAHQLALKTYSATKAFPREELFSLGYQTRQAASLGDNGSRGYQSAAHFDVSRILETWKFPRAGSVLRRTLNH